MIPMGHQCRKINDRDTSTALLYHHGMRGLLLGMRQDGFCWLTPELCAARTGVMCRCSHGCMSAPEIMQVKPELRRLIEAMPMNEGRTNNMTGDFNVGALLPEKRSYFNSDYSFNFHETT